LNEEIKVRRASSKRVQLGCARALTGSRTGAGDA